MAVKKYHEEHIEYLRSISEGRYNDEITDMFNNRFNMNATVSAISTLKARNKISSNITKAKRHYTQKEIAYLRKIAVGKSNKEVTKLMNEKFDTDRTEKSVQSAKFKNNIISFPDLPKEYTKEQVNYLKQITKGRDNATITKMFNKKFNDNRTENGIDSIRTKHGLLTGNDAKFKKGTKPPNWVPLGTERTTVDGYLEIKVKDGCYQENWRGKHIVEWEKRNGPLPKGYVIIFGDGDKTNLDIDNLICVSRKQLLGLNTHDLIQDDAELTRTAINIVDLTYKINERSK